MIYKVEEPEFVGKMPVRTELTVLGADDPGQPTLGWTCQEYSGSEVFLVDADNKVIRTPLTNESDLKPGIKVCVTTLFGDYLMTIESDGHRLSAITDSKGTLALLEFDKDDRHCWTSPGAINLGAIKRLRKETGTV